MENTENTTPAVVVEEEQEQQSELPAEELFQNLTNLAEEEESEPEQQEEEQHEEETEHALTPEEAHKKTITDGLQEMFEDGWSQDELLAFSKDKTVREQLAAGKNFMRVVAAYERRQRSATKPASKKSPPTIRTAATYGANEASEISKMTDAQFDELSRRAKAALLEGKLVSFK